MDESHGETQKPVGVRAGSIGSAAAHGDPAANGPPAVTSRVLRDLMHRAVAAVVKAEVDDLLGRGVIQPARFDDPSVAAAMAGMVDEAENGEPDPLRVDLLRRAFRAVLIGDAVEDPEGTADEDMFELARRLSPVQAGVLDSLFRHHEAIAANSDAVVCRDWREDAMRVPGVLHAIALEESVAQLHGLGLAAAGLWDGVGWGPLTAAGVALCRFLARAARDVDGGRGPETTPAE